MYQSSISDFLKYFIYRMAFNYLFQYVQVGSIITSVLEMPARCVLLTHTVMRQTQTVA